MKHYIELTKPRITWLILMSTGIGFYFGAHAAWSWAVLIHTLIGTGLLASGTAALNQWYEWDADANMERTRHRPIPAGHLSRRNSFLFAVVLSLAGFAELGLFVNWLTAGLGLFTLVSYLFLYTPLKRRTPQSTTIGAIPGAMPPMIGYAAAHGAITPEAWALYVILFVWQFPHFYAIAYIYREDYGRAGIRMLPAVDAGVESTAWHILLTSVLLLPASLVPVWLSMAGAVYLGGATALGLWFLYAGIRAWRRLDAASARSVLLASVFYLPALYGLMLVDRALP
jgi:protoheme IX farnesyltransferase